MAETHCVFPFWFHAEMDFNWQEISLKDFFFFFKPISKPWWFPMSFKTWKTEKPRVDWLPFSSIIQEALHFELIMAKRLTRLGYLGPPRTPNPPAQGPPKPQLECQEYHSKKRNIKLLICTQSSMPEWNLEQNRWGPVSLAHSLWCRISRVLEGRPSLKYVQVVGSTQRCIPEGFLLLLRIETRLLWL